MAAATTDIGKLIVAAASGAADGIKALKEGQIKAELEEFEIEVNFSASTELTAKAAGEVEVKFAVAKGTFSSKTAYKRTTTYGLKVRFVFTGEPPPAP